MKPQFGSPKPHFPQAPHGFVHKLLVGYQRQVQPILELKRRVRPKPLPDAYASHWRIIGLIPIPSKRYATSHQSIQGLLHGEHIQFRQ